MRSVLEVILEVRVVKNKKGSSLVVSKTCFFVASISSMAFYLFGFKNFSIFDGGEDMAFLPAVLLIVFIASLIACRKAEIKTHWHLGSVELSSLMLVFWSSFLILFVVAYSDCPQGLC